MEKTDIDCEVLKEAYEQARLKSFCRASALERLKSEDPELLFYFEAKRLKMVKSSPYLLGFIGASYLFHRQALNHFLGKGFHWVKLGYYGMIYGCFNILSGYLIYDSDFTSKSRSLSIKYESYLLELDPSLKKLHENYKIS